MENIKNEQQDLKTKIDNYCGCCQPIEDKLCKNIFDVMSYMVLIRLFADIFEEARKYRPNITLDDIINGINDGKIKVSLYGYDILSPDSGERPKVEFVD